MIQLVTGGCGYFGSLLLQRLTELGLPCRSLDINPPDERVVGVEYLMGDIREPSTVSQALQDVDVVYHCVAQVPLAKNRELFWSVNLEGTRTLLDACGSVKKLVLLSSSAVFGIPEKNPVDDSVSPRPVEEYGRAKLAAERLAMESSLDVTVIRPRTILGYGRLGIFGLVFSWVAEGRTLYVLGRGDNLYQFVHAEDLAAACIAAAARPGKAVYNIGAADFTTMRETLEGLIERAGGTSRVRSLPKAPAVWAMKLLSYLGLAPFAPYHWIMYGEELYFDLTKPRAELGWEPRWSNVDMMYDSYEHFLAHRGRHGLSHHRSPVKEGLLRILRWFS
jgi:nucleoside-diphosphate-sugar epimerase